MPKTSSVPLTNTSVKNLKPQGKRFEVFDAQVPGFGIRMAPSGRKTWIAFGRQHGRRARATLGVYRLGPEFRPYALTIKIDLCT